MMRKYFLIYLLMLSFLNYSGQNNYKNDMLEVSKNMEKMTRYSVNLKYYMYLDNNLSQPFQTRVIHINSDGNKVNMIQGGDFEIIETEKEHVNVSHKNKRVYYSKNAAGKSGHGSNNEHKIDEMYKLLAENYDSLKHYIEKVSLLSYRDGIKEYEIIYTEGDYTKMKIGLNMKKKIFTYIVLHYREKRLIRPEDTNLRSVCMRVDYENYDTAPVFDPGTFNVAKIISGSEKEKIGLSQKFKNYRLIIF